MIFMNTGLKMKMLDKIRESLMEDITYKDISADAIIDEDRMARADLIAKEDGIICGLEVFYETFRILDQDVKFTTSYKDGQRVSRGDKIGLVECRAQAMLLAERTGLNFLQRMSGIASMTRLMVDRLGDESVSLVDTRKTAPGLRVFDKYSVEVGGGKNHRYNLSDMVMLKDNHIGVAGGIRQAVEMTRDKLSFSKKIEVEVETIDQVREALEVGCDIIMLDNMSLDQIRKAVGLIGDQALIEVSGNISLDNIGSYKGLGVDIISCGALTHSVKALDISLKNMKII